MHKIVGIVISLVFLIHSSSAQAHNDCLVEKYIFDIGSGGVKNTGYLVDKCSKKVINIIASYYDTGLRLQECISNSPDGKTITPSCIKKGEETISSIQKKLGINCKHQQCKAIVTAWGRTAKNPEDLIEKIRSQGLKISILNQHDEGKLAFLGLSASSVRPEDTLVFDLGGGSFQLSGKNSDDTIYVYKGPYGMFNFKHSVLAKFGDGKTDILPPKSLVKIKDFSLKEIGYGVKQDIYLKNKSAKMKVVATGAFMNNGIKDQLELGECASLTEIEAAISNLVGKTAVEIQKIYPKLPIEHAVNTQFSLLIIYAVMKEAKLSHLNIIPNNKIYEYLAIHDKI